MKKVAYDSWIDHGFYPKMTYNWQSEPSRNIAAMYKIAASL